MLLEVSGPGDGPILGVDTEAVYKRKQTSTQHLPKGALILQGSWVEERGGGGAGAELTETQ